MTESERPDHRAGRSPIARERSYSAAAGRGPGWSTAMASDRCRDPLGWDLQRGRYDPGSRYGQYRDAVALFCDDACVRQGICLSRRTLDGLVQRCEALTPSELVVELLHLDGIDPRENGDLEQNLYALLQDRLAGGTTPRRPS